MTPEISSVAGRRSGIAAFMRVEIHFPTFGPEICVTHYEPDFRCLLLIGRIVEVYGQT
jgi:hypothetical protein